MSSNFALPLLLLALGVTCGTVLAQQKAPTEAQCRQMADAMIVAAKSPPPQTERDKREASALAERVEKIRRDTRTRGGSECDAWAEIGRMATRQ